MDQDKCTASPPVGEEYPCEGVPDGVTTADDLFAALATALTTVSVLWVESL